MSIEHVVDGIEAHENPDGFTDPTCGRCGGATIQVECDQCDEDGFTHHDCGEDSCCCLRPENNVRCDTCGGVQYWWVCASSRTWCEEHPLPGRDEVDSTAMSAEAWRDID